jgi:hypothetical protein
MSLHLEVKFDFFPNASTSAFVADPYNEVFIYVPFPMPPLLIDPSFSFQF